MLPLRQVLLAGFSLAGGGFAQSHPRAFPRNGATKLFENERVMVRDATWPIGVEQPIHQHKNVFLRLRKDQSYDARGQS